jgi:putative salt-induced outer membrane protein YdiY
MNRKFSMRVAVFAFAFGFGTLQAVAEDETETGWSGEGSASFAAQTGTVDTVAATGDAEVVRTWKNDRVSIRFTGSYGTSSETGGTKDTIQDNQALRGAWRRRLMGRLFLDSRTLVSRDSAQDRRLRFMLNTGPGYRVWRGEDEAKSHFDVSAGIGYRYEVYDGNTDNTGGTAGDFMDTDIDHLVDLVAAFEYKNMLFDDKIDFTHTAGIALPANSTTAYIIRSEAIIGVPLTGAWSFRTSFVVEYTNQVPDRINKTQTNTTIGLGYKF